MFHPSLLSGPWAVRLFASGLVLTGLLSAEGTARHVDGASWVRTRLVRPPEGPDADAKGRIDARSFRGRDELVIKGQRLTQGAVVSFLIENASGDLEEAAAGTVESDGDVKVHWRSRDGGLPFGANLLSELSGRAVALRDVNGADLLIGEIGTVPAVNVGRKEKALAHLTNEDVDFAPKGKGIVKVELRPRQGTSKLGVHLVHVPLGSTLELWIKSPSGGGMEKVGEFVVSGTQAKIQFNTASGQALPFGVDDASALYGQDLEVRTPDGVVHFSGEVPAPALE